jgi:spore germination protein YaaH
MALSYRRTIVPVIFVTLVLLPLAGHDAGTALGQAQVRQTSGSQNARSSAQEVRWGFYVTYNPNSWASLQANAKHLNYVSPWFYNVSKEGLVTGRDQPHVTYLLRSMKIKNLPMVQNSAQYNDFSALLSDEARRATIITSIETLIAAYNYDGITIDFEGINPTDRPLLTTFMGELYARLHPQGKLVVMAVAAKSREVSTGWAAAYDYAALSAVTDYLLIMAYDFHWAGGNPGPIAPMDKLRATAAYAVNNIPAHKIIWGIGVYGYDWPVRPVQTTATVTATATATATPTVLPGGTSTPPSTPTPAPARTAEPRSHAEAVERAGRPGAQSGYDEQAHAPWVRYTGDGMHRELWYENRRSFEAKLEIIDRYGMAGFSLWRLGQEDPAIWETVAARRFAACEPVKPFKSVADAVYFPETGHSLSGAFLRYWRTNGGLPIFGYPITEPFMELSPTDGKRYLVQYFERNRFEYHPENRPPNDVLLGLLGVQVTAGRTFPTVQVPTPSPDTVYFPQVRHTLSSPFLSYWQRNGGLERFGYPISEPLMELNPTDGKTYLVQYMQRARFEYHPEYRGTDAEVLLGLLGRDVSPCKP